MIVTMTATGADRVSAKARRAITLSRRDSAAVTQNYGTMLVQLVKQNASGRPGPNIITGEYRSSIRVVERGRYTVAAGTNAPQAMRLEYGFVGVDSMGRSYDQPAFPHWAPAKAQLAPQYTAAMRAASKGWWR